MSEITTRLWWIRHAPADHGGRIYGQLDLLCDCSKTAIFEGLAGQLPRGATMVRAGLPGPETIPGPQALAIDDFAEQHFGEWQGLAYEDLNQLRAGELHRFWHAPAHEVVPGGESFLAVIERGSRAIHQLVETYAGRDVIAVVRGGTVRAALALALGLDPEAALAFTIENCSITRIDHIVGPGMGHGWRVVTVNRPPC